jgi:hypothetical protein
VTLVAKSVLSTHRHSFEAGQRAAKELRAGFPAPPKLVLCYLTVSHDQEHFLRGVASQLEPHVAVLGCSGQGVMGRGAVHEDGYAASVMALGGDGLQVAIARAADVQVSTQDKGAALGQALRAQLRTVPRVTLMHYDPLCGADLDVLLGGLHRELEAPVLGGAAGHFFDAAMTTTYQYFGTEVFSKGAVAVSLAGNFGAEMVMSTGCSTIGIEMCVTRAAGNVLLELDGRSAVDAWREVTGATGEIDVKATSSLAIGVPVAGVDREHLVRAAFVFDKNTQGVIVGGAIPEGTRITLYHRTVEDTLNGARGMVADLNRRLAGRTPRALLGFECGGRTRPFLGNDATNAENRELQAAFSAEAEWAGLTCWGELFPIGGRPAFHNYTYPLLALTN